MYHCEAMGGGRITSVLDNVRELSAHRDQPPTPDGSRSTTFAPQRIGHPRYLAVYSPQLTGCCTVRMGPIVALLLAVIAQHVPKLVDPGVCQTCGYNLTGSVSGVCSEPGTEIDDP